LVGLHEPKIAWSDKYLYTLPEAHRFPIGKYELVKDQLLHEGTIMQEHLYDPGLVDEEIILLTHTAGYWQKLKNLNLTPKEIRRIGLPVTELTVNRARNSVAGTISSAENALAYGIGMNLAGGTHHAYAGHGEGFCILNDIAIAANYLLHQQKVKQILIIDLDVHQGNGTAYIFRNENQVFTFSIHGENNYPLIKEESDVDIGLAAGTTDVFYLETVSFRVPDIIQKVKPDIIFYQSGVDILDNDKLGKINITRKGALERDKIVINSCYKGDIPLVITMGGGYTASLKELVEAHCNTFRTAIEVYF
jgi:acetoin utilization deacetylase AcuC-like enzyme